MRVDRHDPRETSAAVLRPRGIVHRSLVLVAIVVLGLPARGVAIVGEPPMDPEFVDSGQTLGAGISTAVALGDLDGDGDLDAIVVHLDAPGEVWVNQGGAQGGTVGVFETSGEALGADSAVDVAVGDLDTDGDLDAVVVRDGFEETIEIWINQGGAQAGEPGTFQGNGQALDGDLNSAVALGSLDGGASLDIYVARSVGRADQVWLNDGAGQLSDSGQRLGRESGVDVALGDLDGDGDLDAFLANGAANRVWVNQGGAQGGTAGVFEDSGQEIGNVLSQGVALGDLDGDGDLDAFVVDVQTNRVWVNQGGEQGSTEGTFVDSGQAIGTTPGRAVALGDLDGDGDLDALVATGAANRVYMNQGGDPGGTGGTFRESAQSLGADLTEDVALGDLDGDGDLDAFAANWSGADRVWFNQETRPPPPPVNPEGWQLQLVDAAGSTGHGLSLALDGDGRPHLSYVEYRPVQSGRNCRLFYTRWDGIRWIREQVDQFEKLDFETNTALRLDGADRPHILYPFGNEDSEFGLRHAAWDGRAWQRSEVTADSGPHVSLAVDAAGTPHAGFWREDRLLYAFWNGTAWEEESVAGLDSTLIGTKNAIAVAASGEVHLLHADPDGVLRYSRRSAGGWETETVEDDSVDARIPGLALDAAGTLHATYIQGLGQRLFYAVRFPGGWEPTEVLDVHADFLEGPATLALGAGGEPHILSSTQSGTVVNDVFIPEYSLRYTRRSEGRWITDTVDTSGKFERELALALDGAGTPHAAYRDTAFQDVRHATFEASWQFRTVTPSLTAASNIDATTSQPIISYHDVPDGRVKLAEWVEGSWQSDPVAFISNRASATSMAIDNGGRRYLSFHDADQGRLLFASSNGTSWEPAVIDDTGDVGRHHRLLLVGRSAALARIVYWDASRRRIKIARFDARHPLPEITTNFTGPTLDAASGALDATVLPEGDIGVSYHDARAGDLRFAVWERQTDTWSDERIASGGAFPAIATDGGDGFPVVAYHDAEARLLRYAWRDAAGWQSEVAVRDVAEVKGLALELGLDSLLRGRIGYLEGPEDALRFAARSDDGWTLETVELGGVLHGFEDLAQALSLRPHLAYRDSGSGLRHAFRTATLDVRRVGTRAPPASTSQPNPLDICVAVIGLFFFPDDDEDDGEGAGAGVPETGPVPLPLDDQALFARLTDRFRRTADGRHFIDLYRRHGSEMGKLGLRDPVLLWDAYGTLMNFLPGLEALVNNRGDEVLVTQEMVDDALDIWQRLAAAGSPELARDVRAELSRFRDLQDFAGKTFAEWEIALVEPEAAAGPRFRRGDCNGDGDLDISDAVVHLLYNFRAAPPPPCRAACDASGEGDIGGVTDAIHLLQYLFSEGAAPAFPFPLCGRGTLPGDAALGCERASRGCE